MPTHHASNVDKTRQDGQLLLAFLAELRSIEGRGCQSASACGSDLVCSPRHPRSDQILLPLRWGSFLPTTSPSHPTFLLSYPPLSCTRQAHTSLGLYPGLKISASELDHGSFKVPLRLLQTKADFTFILLTSSCSLPFNRSPRHQFACSILPAWLHYHSHSHVHCVLILPHSDHQAQLTFKTLNFSRA